jgi:hypothetical protein
LPFFGRKKDEPTLSIRNVPKWEEAIKFLGIWFGVEYEIARTPSVQEIYRTTVFEAARDRKHLTQLLPNSANAAAHFKDFESLRLDQLNVYPFSNDSSVEPVGYGSTQVNRMYIDGFVACMNELYALLWTDIHAMVRTRFSFPEKPRSFPMALISDQMTFIIAPRLVRGEQQTKTGTYYPAPKAHE